MTDAPQPLLTHLLELRRRLILAFATFVVLLVLCYSVSDIIFAFLVKPLAELLVAAGGERRLIYTGLTEAFLTYIKVAAFAAAFLSFPVWATQAWMFIAPGLYKHEQKLFLPLLIATPLLFLSGAVFAYYVVFPLAYSFFLSFETSAAATLIPIQLEAKVNEYLSFVMRLVLAFGVSFELPVLMTVLATTGMVTAQTLIKRWRLAIVCIFAVAALITPPDAISMLALAFPLILLYGLSICMVHLVHKQRLRKHA